MGERKKRGGGLKKKLNSRTVNSQTTAATSVPNQITPNFQF